MSQNNEAATVEQAQLPVVYIDDVLMTLKYFIDESIAHIQIIDPDVCVGCERKSCLYFCPVAAYREKVDGGVQLAYQSCIEPSVAA